MFKYSLVSDLHLDHGGQPRIPPLEEFVIVAGDTANGLAGLKYLNKLKRQGHTVFAVDGNHEHYSNLTKRRYLDETEDDFYIGLQQDTQIVLTDEKLVIIGTNGWYEVRDEEHWFAYMNDGRYGNTSAREVNKKARHQSEYLSHKLKQLEEGWRAIVVTHTSPHPMSLDPRYIGSDGNQYFFNPYMEDVMIRYKDKIAIWNHGHTHRAMDQVIHGVRVVTNPRGYPGENPDWKPLTLEIK